MGRKLEGAKIKGNLKKYVFYNRALVFRPLNFKLPSLRASNFHSALIAFIVKISIPTVKKIS